MTDFDPLDLLSASLDRPEHPDADFEAELLDRLLAQLETGPKTTEATGEVDIVLEMTDPKTDAKSEPPSGRANHRARILVAAAAIVALVAILVVATRDDSTQTVATGAPPSEGQLDLTTAEVLLERAGGLAGIEIATIPADRPTTLFTFDPLDPDRVLIGDTIGRSADLWTIDDGEATSGTLPWLEEQNRFWQGGIFQRDGEIIVYEGAANNPTEVTVLDNAGELLGVRDVGSGPSYLPVGENGTVLTLTTGAKSCPYDAVVSAGPNGPVTLDDQLGAFVRTEIVEPGVGMAFPHLGPLDRCDPPASSVARAWDLATGEALPDYPLDGQELARAIVSGDGTLALVMDPDGVVSTVSMESGDIVERLGNFEARYVLNPLTLNADGSLAVVAEDSGRTTVWHTESATLLLDIAGDRAPIQPGRDTETVGPGAGVAYDASRVAYVDAAEGLWRIVTLDPNDWAELACAAGTGVSTEDLAGRGLDPDAGC